MQKIFIMMLLLMLSVSLVSAQEVFDEGGITPDSPFYGLDIALENIRMALTFGDENKINYGLEKADERLEEMQRFGEDGFDIGEFQTANIERERLLDQVKERAEQDDFSGNIDFIELKLQSHVNILESIRDRVSEDAQQGINTAIENSQQGLSQFKDKVEQANKNKKPNNVSSNTPSTSRESY